MAITEVTIAKNAYAPEGAQNINLYSTASAEDLTLGQLIASICIQAATAMESQSVSIMNRMNSELEELETAAGYLKRLSDLDDTISTSDWATMTSWLEAHFNLTSLPDSVSSYDDRMTAAESIGTMLSNSTQSAQEDMIDIQSVITSRDIAFSTSANILSKLSTSMQSNAANI